MARTETSAMLSGLRGGTKVLELLAQEIRKQGGDSEVLMFLTRERFKPNLETIAKSIVACDWRIPASVMRNFAWKAYKKDYDARVSRVLGDTITNLYWTPVLLDLGIPFQVFHRRGEDYPRIPHSIHTALDGKRMGYPLFVDEKHMVVDWGLHINEYLRVGEVIHSQYIEYLAIADTKYFDFDK